MVTLHSTRTWWVSSHIDSLFGNYFRLLNFVSVAVSTFSTSSTTSTLFLHLVLSLLLPRLSTQHIRDISSNWQNSTTTSQYPFSHHHRSPPLTHHTLTFAWCSFTPWYLSRNSKTGLALARTWLQVPGETSHVSKDRLKDTNSNFRIFVFCSFYLSIFHLPAPGSIIGCL